MRITPLDSFVCRNNKGFFSLTPPCCASTSIISLQPPSFSDALTFPNDKQTPRLNTHQITSEESQRGDSPFCSLCRCCRRWRLADTRLNSTGQRRATPTCNAHAWKCVVEAGERCGRRGRRACAEMRSRALQEERETRMRRQKMAQLRSHAVRLFKVFEIETFMFLNV